MSEQNRASLDSFIIRVLNSVGYFMMFPLLALWLIEVKNLSVFEASVIVSSVTFVSKAGSIFIGILINKLGIKKSLVLGLFFAAGSLLIMNFIDSFFMLEIFGILFGISMSLYNIALKTQISLQASETRLKSFAMLNIAVNVGSSIGPLISGFIFDWDPNYLMYFCSSSYFLAGIYAFRLKSYIESSDAQARIKSSRFSLSNSTSFIKFLIFTSIFWIFYIQIFTLIPLSLSDNFDKKIIGILFTFNAVVIIFTQGFFAKYRNKLSMKSWYVIASMLIFLTFLILWTSTNIFLIFISIAIFSLSEIIWVPSIDNQVSSMSGSLSIATAFGIAGVVWGVGESVGSIIGLNLYEIFGINSYLIFTCISFLFFLLNVLLKFKSLKNSNRNTESVKENQKEII